MSVERITSSSAVATFLALAAVASADVTYNFDSVNQLSGSPYVSGDVSHFVETTAHANSGSKGMHFDYTVPDAYQSFTYDIPIPMTAGSITVWFYDALGASTSLDKFGGSIILEDADTPGDFLAVEIWNGPYPASSDPTPGVPNYYLTRGSSSAATVFKSRYFGDRSIDWHPVTFTISPSSSSVSVDGISNSEASATPPVGPGSSDHLRLRFMGYSASNGGFSNWTTNPTPTAGVTIDSTYVAYDDLSFAATAPAVASASQGFEIVSGTAEYDTPGQFMGPASHDNPSMNNFVQAFETTTTAALVHGGTQSAIFANEVAPFRSVSFDLTAAHVGQISLKMFDAVGPNTGFDKIGGSIIIEQISDPSNFIALEVWNAPYPASSDPTPAGPNYYLTKGISGNPATNFSSRYFGDRTVGWNDVVIDLTSTTSKIRVNGIENSNLAGIQTGPGLSDGIRLRIMADSPSCGGFTNYVTANDLQYLYLTKDAPYLYFDDISLPIAPASASNWMNYE